MIISKKRQYQDTASIREPGRCRPEFCDEPVDRKRSVNRIWRLEEDLRRVEGARERKNPGSASEEAPEPRTDRGVGARV